MLFAFIKSIPLFLLREGGRRMLDSAGYILGEGNGSVVSGLVLVFHGIILPFCRTAIQYFIYSSWISQYCGKARR